MGAGVGLLTTSGNETSEGEWRSVLPADVSLDLVRMGHPAGETDRSVKREDLARCCDELSALDVDVAAYGCTVGSSIREDSATFVADLIESRVSLPAVTAAGSVVAALEALRAGSVAVSTPYTERKTAAIGRFLRDNGLGLANIDDAGTRLDSAYEEGLAVDLDGADAVFISCMNHPTFPAIEPLEAALGKPVVTSNQATLWNALRVAGADLSGIRLGRLLEARPA